MRREFYIFRHGETDWNREKRCQGHTDIPLNQTGKEQARLLAQKFAAYEVDVIFSSDLSRAFETAQAISTIHKVPLFKRRELRESHLGELEGLTAKEAKERIGEEIWGSFRRLDHKSLEARFPGGESRHEVLSRLKGFVEEMIQQETYNRIGVSTHGGALRNLIHSFLPEGTEAIPIPNCALYKISYLPEEEKCWFVEGPL